MLNVLQRGWNFPSSLELAEEGSALAEEAVGGGVVPEELDFPRNPAASFCAYNARSLELRFASKFSLVTFYTSGHGVGPR